LQWGSSIALLQDIHRRTGEIPPALARRPHLRGECRIYLEAFGFLSASRDSNGYGPNPIRIGEVGNYAAMWGMSRDETLKLLRLVQAMDAEYLRYCAEKNKTLKGE
jgi:hypothetical protein